MKKKYFLLLLLPMLASCINFNSSQTSQTHPSSSDSSSSEHSTSESSTSEDIDINPEEYGLVDNVQDGVILHAWNWSMNEIKKALPEIAASGYSTIQTSPMQPQKDYSGSANWKSDWWKLYQPLGFSIATKNHALGTKSELEELCKEAEKYGIKIIVDVVSNHLAGGSAESFHPNVKDYEPEIYNQNLLHKGVGYVDDNNVKQLVQGHLGEYPDLMTESSVVSNSVLDLLKEYVDVGVDGFRFDATKHIETSHDGIYASNFWDVILSGSNEYAKSLGHDQLYFYGEILNTPGNGRDISWYTDVMSVTDNKYGNGVLSNVRYGNSNINGNYSFSMTGSDCVIWAESHDTYANDSHETTFVDISDIHKAYAINASRKDAASLYFARPTDSTTLGSIGTTYWKSKSVAAINKFHNQFVGGSEKLGNSNDIFYNLREKDGKTGLVLVNFNESNIYSIDIPEMKDGTYKDYVSGNVVEVINGHISGEFSEDGFAVIYNSNLIDRPIIQVDNDGSQFYYDTIDVTINVSNATESYYILDNGEKVFFNEEIVVTLGKGFNEGINTLKIVAKNEKYSIEKTYTYVKKDINNLSVTVNNIPNQYCQNKQIVAWVWKSGEDGRWVNGDLKNNTFTFPITSNDTHFLLASFPLVVTPDWTLKPYKTVDIKINSDGIIDCSQYTWQQSL